MDTPQWFALGAVSTGLVSLALQIAVLFVDRGSRGRLLIRAANSAAALGEFLCPSPELCVCALQLARLHAGVRLPKRATVNIGHVLDAAWPLDVRW